MSDISTIVTPAKRPLYKNHILDGINWNNISDQVDIDVWNRVTSNFWLPEKIPVSNDIPTWNQMTAEEQLATMRVFTGLTMLDTIQGTVGAVSLISDSQTPHEEAVYTNFGFMESVHAKSYSNIFMTLAPTKLIDESFEWSRGNKNLQLKGNTILDFYEGSDKPLRKMASVILESFLFYSGFYLPLRFASLGKITNSADIIRLIIRDEAIHGYYIGYKYQTTIARFDRKTRDRYKDETISLLLDLYDNECAYTDDIYSDIGWADDVKGFLKYNANKAMNNLGYEVLFPKDECVFNSGVMTALDPSSNENHDFFSGSGSSYVIGTVEETQDDDWAF